MSRIGQYDHLDPVALPLDLDALAKLIEGSSYGTHRLLSALVRVRRGKYAGKGYRKVDQLTEGIAELLEEGCY